MSALEYELEQAVRSAIKDLILGQRKLSMTKASCHLIENEIMAVCDVHERKYGVDLPERVPVCIESPYDRNGTIFRMFWQRKQYQHDCDDCFYFGTSSGADYYGHFDGISTSFIARYGSKGPEYTSSPLYMLRRIPQNFPHAEAILCCVELAQRRGFLKDLT